MEKDQLDKKVIWGSILPAGSLSFEEAYKTALKNAPPETGDLVSFVGIVRHTSIYEKKKVMGLEVEGWEEGKKIMHDIAFKTYESYNLTLSYILHLTGMIRVGEPIVYVILGSEHRDSAFAALKYAVDLYKKEAPVWKKEIYDDGTGKWITTKK